MAYFISIYNQLAKSSLMVLPVYKGVREMEPFHALGRKNQARVAIMSLPTVISM